MSASGWTLRQLLLGAALANGWVCRRCGATWINLFRGLATPHTRGTVTGCRHPSLVRTRV